MPGNTGDWIVSGGSDSNNNPLDSVVVYGSSSESWSSHSTLPVSVYRHCMVTLSSVYLVGGDSYGGVMSDVYTLSGSVWSKHSSLNTARRRHMCAVLEESIVVIGGLDSGFNYLSSVEVLPPGGDIWVPGPPLPVEVVHGQVVEYSNSLYVLGGFNNVGDNNQIFRLDSLSDQWVTVDKQFSQQYRDVFPAPLLYEHQLHCN